MTAPRPTTAQRLDEIERHLSLVAEVLGDMLERELPPRRPCPPRLRLVEDK